MSEGNVGKESQSSQEWSNYSASYLDTVAQYRAPTDGTQQVILVVGWIITALSILLLIAFFLASNALTFILLPTGISGILCGLLFIGFSKILEILNDIRWINLPEEERHRRITAKWPQRARDLVQHRNP